MDMKKQVLSLLFVFLYIMFPFLISSSFLLAQSPNPPKVGLVLSGGGAKGLAHIGILKALEEAGIVPDYITGTSMGSIMGGLYAIGYSADEIKAIALNAPWDELLSNQLKWDEVVYEEKDYHNRYIYEFSMDGLKFQLPKGLIEGQKLSMLLSYLTRPVQDIENFSDFPIPYACIAADIETGEKVVLNSGSLSRSMRASMAIPSIFTPVIMDDRLLVDGGLVHNFPVEENIEMGADYIIGVFVGTHLMKREEMGSPLSLLTQSSFILASMDTKKQTALTDLYIEPDMTQFSGGDFHEAEDIIAMGEKYGQMYLEQFKILKDSMEALGRRNPVVEKPEVSDSFYLSTVNIINNEWVPKQFIIDRLRVREGEINTIEHIERRITELYGTGYFTKLIFELKESEEGQELIIDVEEAPEGKLRFGLHFDRETGTSLLLNITQRNLLLKNSRLIMEGEIAENPLFDVNYLKYFGLRQDVGFKAGYYYRNAEVPNFNENLQTGLLGMNYNEFYAGIISSHRINRALELTFAHQEASLRPQISGSDLIYIQKVRFDSRKLSLAFNYNNLDDLFFPGSGQRFSADLRFAFNSAMDIEIQIADTTEVFSAVLKDDFAFFPRIRHQLVKPVGKNLVFSMTNAIQLSLFNDDDSISIGPAFLNANYIGGFTRAMPNFQPFLGAGPLQYYSENIFYNELILRYEFLRNLFVDVKSQFYHAYYPMAFLFPDLKEDLYLMGDQPYLLGVGATLSWASPLGPFSFSIGKGNTGLPLQYHINLGFYFDKE